MAQEVAGPPCDGSLQLTPEQQAWVDTLCAVRAATFDDQADPGTAFLFAAPVDAPGAYTGATWQLESVSFDVVWVLEIDFSDQPSPPPPAGFEARLVVGTLSGPAGAVPLVGTVIKPTGVSSDLGYLLMVSQVISAAELGDYAQITAIRDGVTVANSIGGGSTPLSSVHGPVALSGSATDLSRLTCICPGSGTNLAAVTTAYQRYVRAVDDREFELRLCLAWALLRFLACAQQCVEGPFISPLHSLSLCLKDCVSYYTYQVSMCHTWYNLHQPGHLALITDLRAARVTIP